MNPDNIPVKFPLHTRVKVINSKVNSHGRVGRIVQERGDGYNNKIAFDDGGYLWYSDHELEAVATPEVGDLVRVTHTGRWQAHEGNVTSIDEETGLIFVDLDYDWERPKFQPEYLEIIEKIKPKVVRIEGKPIKPEAIKRGDKISIVTVVENEIKRTTILEATVDKIITKGFYGKSLEFQTRTGAKIHSTMDAPDVVISLVADIDKDTEYAALSKIKPNEIIGFPDVEGGTEVNIAVKKEYGAQWTVLLGEKSAKNMETAGLVAVLKKKGVTFSVIRKTPNPLDFPNGTNVKVLSTYPINLSGGDYRVVIEHPSHSVIKSRGISATTYTVPNEYLRKG